MRLGSVDQPRPFLARDIQSPLWIKLKGLLFLAAGLASSLLIIAERPSLKIAFLIVMVVWSFCRFYYFAFYVIERYVDPQFRYSGIVAMLRYLAYAGRKESRGRSEV